MDERVKVVIEMPKERYEWIKEHKGLVDYQITEMLYSRVRRGTLIEDELTYSDVTDSKAGVTEDELKQHLYELSFALDNYSAGKDYVALRRTHYDNIEWLQNHGLTNEYYEVLFAHIKANRKDTE